MMSATKYENMTEEMFWEHVDEVLLENERKMSAIVNAKRAFKRTDSTDRAISLAWSTR